MDMENKTLKAVNSSNLVFAQVGLYYFAELVAFFIFLSQSIYPKFELRSL